MKVERQEGGRIGTSMGRNKKLRAPQTPFRMGKNGGSEAHLFEFREQGGADSRTVRIAAVRLDEALFYLQWREPDFLIASIHNLGVVLMVSGSPVD